MNNNNAQTETKKVSLNLDAKNVAALEKFNKRGISVTLLLNKVLSHYVSNSYKPEYNDLNKELGLNTEGIPDEAKDIKIELLERHSENDLFAQFNGFSGKGILITKIPLSNENTPANNTSGITKLILMFKVFAGSENNITPKLLYVELSFVPCSDDYIRIDNALSKCFDDFQNFEAYLKENQKDHYFSKKYADDLVIRYYRNQAIKKSSLDCFDIFYNFNNNSIFKIKELLRKAV